MKLTRNVFTIADLSAWLDNKSLRINHDYQRARGLWPVNARTYFIDTILNGFPFPKIIIRQTVDLKTRQSIREIIDGQQRMMAINDYIHNDFPLSKVSKKFGGKKFEDLEEDIQRTFLSYEVSVDTVIGAPQEEVLEVFRRINSYTLPLNEPEKRHATYQGLFKWFIKDMIEYYTPFFESCSILTEREISRMEDADLMTEFSQILIDGVLGRRASKLEGLYRAYNENFEEEQIIEAKIKETLDFVKVNLYKICENKVLKGYSLYSLFAALVYNKWGLKNIRQNEVDNIGVIGEYAVNSNTACQNMLELFLAVDQRDENGKFAEFVKGCTTTTHSVLNRKIRLKWMVKALQNRL